MLTQAPLFSCLSGVTCLVSFIICLLFAQQSGLYWVTLFDNFAGSIPLLTIGLTEMIAVVYIYGIDRLVHKVYVLLDNIVLYKAATHL